jgi:threonylcarbamoyladenosine tRNA methylthiotransferase MtaB
MKVIIETLGCKVNFLESERIKKELSLMGFSIVDDDADFAIVNTCTVTDTANKKSFDRLKKFQQKAKKVIITGCAARIDNEFGDFVVLPNYIDVVEYFRSLQIDLEPRDYQKTRTRAFVEIQRGCESFCSYCIIPFTRGRSESIEKSVIIDEVKSLYDEGIKEIVLTGINLMAWGAESTNRPATTRFDEILRAILNETKMPRVRISSIGPEFVDQRFFDLYENPRICDHLHISIQSGSEKILEAMNRGHGADEIRYIAENAYKKRPLSALTADFIVGFPGESEFDFQDSLKLARDIKLSKVHVFPFSPRKGTVAYNMQQLDSQESKRRAEVFRLEGDKLRADFIEKNIGEELEVLFEHKEDGLSANYIRIHEKGVQENEIRKVILSRDNLVY